MSDRIPVFFVPVDNLEEHDVDAAEAIIGDAYEASEQANLTTSLSTNWWHQRLTLAMCESLGLKGLGFMEHQVRCISAEDLHAVTLAIRGLLDHLKHQGLPEIDRSAGPELQALAFADLPTAIAEATPGNDIDDATGDVQSFLNFLVSLESSARQAAEAGGSLLWYRPQP